MFFPSGFVLPDKNTATCRSSCTNVGSLHYNQWMRSGSCCGCVSPRVFPRKGESPKEDSVSLMRTATLLRVVAKLKEWKHNGVKRANPAFCSGCIHCEARCDFLNTAYEKRLDFHRPADLLRAGVSQIQFHSFFFFLSSTLPSWRYCCCWIQVLMRIYIKAKVQTQSPLFFFFSYFYFTSLSKNLSVATETETVMGSSPGD